MAAFFSSTAIGSLPGELWKEIPGYNGKYEISNYGRVKSLKRAKMRILHQQINNRGYLRVSLSRAGQAHYYLTHRLVAAAFVLNDDPIAKTTVDHIDANKLNNNASNLRYLSLMDNVRAYYRYKQENSGANNG